MNCLCCEEEEKKDKCVMPSCGVSSRARAKTEKEKKNRSLNECARKNVQKEKKSCRVGVLWKDARMLAGTPDRQLTINDSIVNVKRVA